MHGNTYKTSQGQKTRSFDQILTECLESLRILKEHNEIIGGFHIEASYDDVTECIGGENTVSEEDLSRNYTSLCDPRLNKDQTIEILSILGKEIADRKYNYLNI